MRDINKSEELSIAASQALDERTYWLNKLSGQLVVSNFPYDFKNIKIDQFLLEVVGFEITGQPFSQLMKLSNASDPRLHMIFTALVTVLLDKYTGNKDIIIAAPIEKQDIEGDFINTVLALRNQLHGHMTFKELLLQVRQTAFEAAENQNYPIEALADDLGMNFSETGFPLFDAAVILENIQEKKYLQPVKPNIMFCFLRSHDGIKVRLEYNSLLYRKSTVERIGTHFKKMLEEVLVDINLLLDQVTILLEAEKKQLLVDFNGTKAGYPQDKTLQQLFAEQVEGTPDHIALLGQNKYVISITYRELNKKANQLARVLRAKNVKAGTIVGIMMNPTIEMVIGMIAILKAGGAYLPLDPEYPEARTRFILEDSSLEILLTTQELADNLSFKSEYIYLEDRGIYRGNSSNLKNINEPGDLAYIIYTSGTTGNPKGALIEHRNVVQLMCSDSRLFDFGSRDVWTMFHSYCFDFSVWEMYGALLYGGELVLISRMTARDPRGYLEILKRMQVTVLNQTPTAFYNLANLEINCPGKELPLKYVIFGGEALSPAKLSQWKKKYPHTKLVNMYGITETTVHVTYKGIGNKEIHSGASNIGHPLPTLKAYILDSRLRLVPIGVAGELCVGGDGVGRGYLNRVELTKEKFIGNPYMPGKKFYRSGDLVKWLENGDMEYLGRIDHQVKIRGFRIEPGEIENLLRKNQVKEAVVIVKEIAGPGVEASEQTSRCLCAYFVPEDNHPPAISQLRDHLSRYLPAHSIPSYFIQLDKIPITSNGKLDIKALPEPAAEESENYVAPRSETEKTLAQIWENLLNLEKVGVKDSYFNIGGDSIKAIKLLNLINKTLNVNLEIPDLFINETIEKLAERINQSRISNLDKRLKRAAKKVEVLQQEIFSRNNLAKDENIEDIYPMSDIEKGMVFYSLKEPGRAVYHDQMVHQVNYNDFDAKRFKKALGLMVEKHPILRTGFHIEEFSEPVQMIYKNVHLWVEHEDISHMTRKEQEEHIKAFLARDRTRAFKFSEPPLWRMQTFALARDNIVAVWVCHHSIIDGWSDACFNTEINNIYLKLQEDPGFVPAKLESSYKEFVIEQMALKEDKGTIDYWQSELADYKRWEFPGTAGTGNRGENTAYMKNYFFPLPVSIVEGLNQTAVTYNTSRKHLCFAAYIYMLSMLSYENDIVVGLVTNNRPVCEDGEKILGCFLNTVPVRLKVPAVITWADYIRLVDKKLKELTRYDRLSLFEILKIIGAKGEEIQDQNPIFDVLFNFTDFHIYRRLNREEISENLPAGSKTGISVMGKVSTNTLFNFNVDATWGRIIISISYSDALLEDEMVKKCGDFFQGILNKFIHEVENFIKRGELISSAEKQELLYEFNATGREYPQDKTIHELFVEQVCQTPDNIAVVFHNEFLTYEELNRRSRQVVGLLRQKGVKPGAIVGIMEHRSLEMIIGLLGILQAGGAYLPIDPDYPAERIDYMLADSKAKVLLAAPETQVKAEVEEKNGQFGGLPLQIINMEKLFSPSTLTSTSTLNEVGPANLVYIIYTSGSTGKPKGVLIRHASVVNLVYAQLRCFEINERERILQFSSICFDASVEQVFISLLGGAGLVLIDKDTLLDAQRFEDLIARQCVTHLHAVPSFLNNLSMKGSYSLKRVLSGGDICPAVLAQKWLGYPSCDFYNRYGPTETTVTSIEALVTGVNRSTGVIPIGKPIANTAVYLLDKFMTPVLRGVAGELYIGGDGLAIGYLNQPELTAERFLSVFYRSYKSYMSYISKKIYKTGDLARWLPDGNIEFLGRLDHQVKIRGFRIELGEIENCLLKHRQVKEAAVTIKIGVNEDKYLCAYIAVKHSRAFSASLSMAAELKEFLSQSLPAYMVPAFFIPLEEIPLTPNGKVNHRALPDPEFNVGREYMAPRDKIEERLARQWSEVLGIKKDLIGRNANFFELGGHSLNAMVLVSKIHKEFNIKIPLAKLFEIRTLEGLSRYIKAGEKDVYIGITGVEKKEYYPLSSVQERMYALRYMGEENINYNIYYYMLFEGPLDVKKLEETFKKVIRRHESLRTSFVMVKGELVQRISDQVDFEIKYQEAKEEQIKEIAINFLKPFDLGQAPLLRARLVKIAEERYILMHDTHHIINDAYSLFILIWEFDRLYRGEDLPEVKLHYKDFSEWQNSKARKEVIKKQENYWLKELGGELPVLSLPMDYPRPAVLDFEGVRFVSNLELREVRALRKYIMQENATLFIVTLALYNVLLSKLSGEEDIVVGTALACRHHVESHRIPGMFANTLALRNYPENQKKFSDFLLEVKERTLEAFENQDYLFADLVDKVVADRDISRNPLFDVVVYAGRPEFPELTIQRKFCGLDVKRYNPGHNKINAKFDLTFRFIDEGDALVIDVIYGRKLFKPETIEGFVNYTKKIIHSILEDPEKKISEIEILGEEEKRQLLYDFNDTATEFPEDKSIPRLFAEQAASTPDKIALVGSSQKVGPVQLTYRELDQRTNRVAGLLKTRGVTADTIVGLMVERSVEMIESILGILKAGGAYMPLDPQFPDKRIKYMCMDSGVGVMVTQASFAQRFSFVPDVVLMDQMEIHAPGAIEPVEYVSADSSIYIIYTSGTTGNPKGVLTTHTNVVRVVKGTNYIDIAGDDRILQLSNYAFDGSVFDIYGALLNGAALVLVQSEDVSDAARLSELVQKEQITIFFVTTALFNAIVDVGITCLKDVRKVLFGGEQVSVRHSREALNYLGRSKLIHVYGPTETTVYASGYFIDRIDEGATTIPIGEPISNTSIYILDKYKNIVPVGVNGEVYIGGAGVARGYLNQPELTAEKFLSGFYRSYRSYMSYISKKIYKTGDLARWLPGGDVEFLGRIDQQVKIRGFRIELEEIQYRLLSHEAIQEAVILYRQAAGGEKYICAYVVAAGAPGKTPESSELAEYLARHLPDYMIPSYFVLLDKIPLNPNGKVARKALPEPELKTNDRYIPPRDKLEETLAEIWTKVLGIEKELIGINTSFFKIGGHSLKATLMVLEIHKELEVKVPLPEVFKTPTIKGIAHYIKKVKPDKYASIEPAEEKEFYALSSAQERLYIIYQMDKESLSYNIPQAVVLEGESLDKERFEQVFRQLIQRHEGFRTTFEIIEHEPVQRIHDEVEFEIEIYNSGRQGNRETGRQGNRETGRQGNREIGNKRTPLSLSPSLPELTKEFIRPFDLSYAPLLRVGFIKSKGERYILLVDMHHIISDAVSMSVLFKEFAALYRGEELPPLRLQYTDFSEWQHRLFKAEGISQQENYWLKQLQGEIPVLNLPTDYPRPRVRNIDKGGQIRFLFAEELSQKLSEVVEETGATLFMVLLAAYIVLLHKYSKQEDIIVGTPVTGRTHADLQDIIGVFLNMLAMRNRPQKDKSFRAFLKEVKENALQAFENQDYQFEDLVSRLKVQRDAGRNPLFDTEFAMINVEVEEISIPGFTLKTLHSGVNFAKFDLHFLAFHSPDNPGSMGVLLRYSTELFKPATIEIIKEDYMQILRQLADNLDIKLKDTAVSQKLLTVKSTFHVDDGSDFEL